MTNVFGIYVGNSSASIAIYKEDGKVEILANDAGERVTPVLVRITSKEQVVGSAAVGSLSSRAACTVTQNKTLLNGSLPRDRLEELRQRLPVRTELGDNGSVTYLIEDEDKTLRYSPAEVATCIFRKLFIIGQSALPGSKELGCVLCVPRDWDDDSRETWVNAAEDAGWDVLQLISECPAATLAYRLDDDDTTMNALVYRLGGVSCDSSVIEFEKGFQYVSSSVHSDSLGGERIISLLTKHLADEFRRKFHLDPTESRKSMGKLRAASESMIKILSTLQSCNKFIESVCEGVDWSTSLSRARLEALTSPLLPSLVQPIRDSLEQAKLDFTQIKKVILCGGALKMPKLVSYVTSMFPPEVEVLNSISLDEVLAIGAAHQASYLSAFPLEEPLKAATRKVPVLASSIHLKFSTGEEMTLEDEVIPCTKSLVLNLKNDVLNVVIKQTLENGTNIQGQAYVEDFSPPVELEVHITVTLEHEMMIETVDKSTNEVKTAMIDFKLEQL